MDGESAAFASVIKTYIRTSLVLLSFNTSYYYTNLICNIRTIFIILIRKSPNFQPLLSS